MNKAKVDTQHNFYFVLLFFEDFKTFHTHHNKYVNEKQKKIKKTFINYQQNCKNFVNMII